MLCYVFVLAILPLFCSVSLICLFGFSLQRSNFLGIFLVFMVLIVSFTVKALKISEVKELNI